MSLLQGARATSVRVDAGGVSPSGVTMSHTSGTYTFTGGTDVIVGSGFTVAGQNGDRIEFWKNFASATTLSIAISFAVSPRAR